MEEVSKALLVVGAIVTIIGTLSFVGSTGRGGLFDSQYKYAENTEAQYRRVRINIDLLDSSYRFAAFATVAGILLLVCSFVFS